MAGQVHLGIPGSQPDTMSSMHCVYRSSELIYLAYLNSFIHGIEALYSRFCGIHPSVLCFCEIEYLPDRQNHALFLFGSQYDCTQSNIFYATFVVSDKDFPCKAWIKGQVDSIVANTLDLNVANAGSIFGVTYAPLCPTKNDS